MAQRRKTPLQTMWKSVTVSSLSNGYLMIEPEWTHSMPGIFTRMRAARLVENLIKAHLKGK